MRESPVFGAQMSEPFDAQDELKLRPPWNHLGDGFSVLRAWEWMGRSRNVRACVGGSVRVLRGSCGRSGRPCDCGSCSGGGGVPPKQRGGEGTVGGGPEADTLSDRAPRPQE